MTLGDHEKPGNETNNEEAMKSNVLVPAYWLQKLRIDCILHGMGEDVFQGPAGLEEDLEPTNRRFVPADQVDRIMKALPAIKKEPHCFIKMATSPRLSRIEPLDSLVSTAANLYQAIELFNKYQFLVHPFAKFRVVEHKKTVSVYYSPENENAMAKHRHYLELFLGSMLTFGRIMTGWNISPLQTAFQCAKPEYVEHYEDFFHSPLVFDADYSGMTFDQEDFLRSIVCADVKRNQWAERQVIMLISQTESFTEKVTKIISSDPQPGMIGMSSIANRLQISRRTLHRKLVKSGTSFNRVKDNALFQIAKQLMADPKNSLQQVADQTGFSELSAFHRAFKRWSGFTPSQYRKCRETLSLGNDREFNSR